MVIFAFHLNRRYVYNWKMKQLISIIGILFLTSCQCHVYQGQSLADHFASQKFYNPEQKSSQSFLNIFKWLVTREKNLWPLKVPQRHPPPLTKLDPHEVRVIYITHATTLIQTANFAILTDPIWSERASPFSWIGPKRVQQPGISISNLPKINLILISHNHYDHLDIPTLLALQRRFNPLIIVPLGNAKLLSKYGLKRVKEMDWWERMAYQQTVISLLPAQHWSARWLNDRNQSLWGSYGIEIENKKIYFAGDTGYSPHFKLIYQRWGTPDIALLPIGSYLPRWILAESHISPEEALLAHQDLHANQSMGIHFNVFPLGDEAYNEAPHALIAAKIKFHLKNTKFSVLKPGYFITLR